MRTHSGCARSSPKTGTRRRASSSKRSPASTTATASRDFPTLEAATELVGAFVSHPSIWGVVAERGGRIVGSNFLDERGPVRGVGPITVAPEAQAAGAGRRLMQAVLDRGAGAAGIRLLQDSFNTQSLALYASLGFEVDEPVVVMGGTPRAAPPDDVEVRPLVHGDLQACEQLCLSVHGFERTNELRDALEAPGLRPFAALRAGRVVAYATTLSFFPAAYAVAETQEDMAALIAGALAAGDAPASFLLPTRQHELFRWCLRAGLRIVKPMTYMAIGEHRRPRGAWIPSVLYWGSARRRALPRRDVRVPGPSSLRRTGRRRGAACRRRA